MSLHAMFQVTSLLLFRSLNGFVCISRYFFNIFGVTNFKSTKEMKKVMTILFLFTFCFYFVILLLLCIFTTVEYSIDSCRLFSVVKHCTNTLQLVMVFMGAGAEVLYSGDRVL